ncbi:unnamed protein product [Polarella glacialis]|uniref:PSI domain-containing protein n=1 Tax=Polarella glacialis TaxID=89957 RepID=A0A813HN89_POLGL|nr:unnamed protein product [Polarella glacialis]CAE8658929.1 unnamed protein product [Polarella glacialis]
MAGRFMIATLAVAALVLAASTEAGADASSAVRSPQVLDPRNKCTEVCSKYTLCRIPSQHGCICDCFCCESSDKSNCTDTGKCLVRVNNSNTTSPSTSYSELVEVGMNSSV